MASPACAKPINGARYDLLDSLVGMEEGKLQAQASTKAVQAADDVIGSPRIGQYTRRYKAQG